MSRVRVRYPLYSCCRGVGTVDSAAEVAARRPEKTAQRKRAMVMVVSTGSEVRTPGNLALDTTLCADRRAYIRTSHYELIMSCLVLRYAIYTASFSSAAVCTHARARGRRY
jgi:hypothetical protein